MRSTTSSANFANVEADSFRALLQGELVRRCKSNSHYSLRAFSRFLGVTPSYLSMALNGKRGIPKSKVIRFGNSLGLAPDKMKKYLAPYRSERMLNSGHITFKKYPYHQIAMDHFNVISDWYHYAILELMEVADFQKNPRWIANTLGISAAEAKGAIERLQRLEFIKIKADGTWENCSGSNTNIGNDIVIAARRKLQTQILEKAKLAIENTPITERDQSSITMAIDSNKIPEAKERIKQFRRDLCDFLKDSPNQNRVYHLSLSLYPVSHQKLKESQNA